MDLQEKYDNLYEIFYNLDNLIDDLDKSMIDYIDQLKETKYQAEKELEEIEPELMKQQWQEEEIEENEYWRSTI